ncbi:MAG TPA: FtsX-like permease family protein, partial [Acidimicrobiia bacterium]|nr:FtsX-like permease family protein [Acidimicrobiia bacterium]
TAPVWSSVIGTAFGIVVVVAVALFSASLDQLVSHPAAYGWTWDYVTSDTTAAQTTPATCGNLDTRLTTMKGVAAVASICTLDLDVAGHPVSGWGYTDLLGHIGPTIVRGRAPKVRDEVALGADTLAAVHRQVGDSVRITGARGPLQFRIVGQTLLSRLGDPEPLADGAVFTGAGAARLDSANSDNSSWNLIVRLAPGADRSDTLARLDAISRADTPLLGAALPAEIDRIRQIDALPIALAAFVGVVALAAVGFALVTTVRRRRRELAVLKTLGFRRGQVRATVAWHATTVALVGLVVGIPLGLVVGRFLWHEVATELGVSTDPTWPVLAAAVLVPVALVAVNLIAAVPARSAARTRPAVVLRSE